MLVTKNQIFVLLACVAFGAASGVLFSASGVLKFFIKNKHLKILPDIAAFAVFSGLYVWFSYSLEFPSYRLYMTAGAIVGLLLYMKSFNIMLAFRAEKLYNITVKRFAKHKIKKETSGKKDVSINERQKRSGKRDKRKKTV